MADEIARGEIHVEVNDRAALAALKRIDTEFDRTMASIDRQDAEVEIRAKTDKLKKDLADADKMVAASAENRAKAETTADKRSTAAKLASAKRRRDALHEELREQKNLLEARGAENKELALTEKRVKAIEKAEAARTRALEQADRRRVAAARTEQRDIEQTQRLREREAAAAERIRTKADRDAMRAEQLRQRELDAIPKMQRRYVSLARTIEKYNSARRKVKHDQTAKLEVDLKISEAVAEMERLNTILERVGSPVRVDVDLNPGRDFGARMRKTIQSGFRDDGVLGAARDAGVVAGIAFSAGVAGATRRTLSPKNILGGLGAAAGRFGHMLGNLSNLTVRLGPFTATIRQAFIGLSLLAPIILDVVGALSALVGVAGSAAVGLGALTLGFLGGAIPAMAGMGFVIKDVVQEFGAVKKAQKAYDDAAAKGNTDLAAKKMKELKSIMGNVSQETVKQVGLAQKIGDAWDKATSPARASVWGMIGQGLQTANSLLPMFARNTNQAMGVAEKATTRWMEALRSKEGKGILDNLMGNFTESLGPILNGLGNIGAYLGKVASVASDSIPGIAKTFQNWSKRLLDTADNTDALRERVEKVIQSAKDVGRFFLSAGRLMKAFFGGGVESGQKFVNTMSDAMDRWTAGFTSGEGQASLLRFFDEAVAGTQSLYAFLAPVMSSFTRWAGLMSPWVRMFFDAAAGAAEFASALLRVTGLQGPVAALVTTLGALWAIGKMAAATRAVSGFARALFGLGAAQTALGATGAASAAGQMALFGSAADKSGRKVGTLRAAATRLVPAIGGLGALAGGLATAGITALAGAALYGTYKLITMKTTSEKLRESFEQTAATTDRLKNATEVFEQSMFGADEATRTYGKNVRSVAKLKEALSAAEEKQGRKSQEYQSILSTLNGELQNRERNESAIVDLSARAMIATNEGIAASLGMLKAHNDVNNALRERDKWQQIVDDAGKTVEPFELKKLAEANETLNMALDARSGLQEKVNRAEVVAATLGLNTLRLKNNMLAVTGYEQAALARLAQQSQRTARAVARAYADPKDVGRVSRAATGAIKAGVAPTTTMRIVADSRNAEQAIRRLRNISIPEKTLKIIEKGGDRAVRTIQDIKGSKLTAKEQRIVENGGPNVLAKLAQIKGSKLANKILRILGDDSVARRVLARVNGMTPKELTQFIGRQLRNTGAEFPAPPPVQQNVYRRLTPGRVATGSDGLSQDGATPGTQRSMDRALTRGMQGTLRRSSTSQSERGMKVSGPRAIWGEEPQHPEFVISTNPSYRRSNIDYLRSAASRLGVDMAATGDGEKKNPPLSNKGRRKAVSRAREVLKNKRTRVSGKFKTAAPELRAVTTAQRDEDNFRDVVSREAGAFDSLEPESFLKVVGTDPYTGEKTYAVDQGAVTGWEKALESMAARFDELGLKIQATLTAVNNAMNRLRGGGGIVPNANKNIDTLTALIESEGKRKKKAKTKAGKQSIEAQIGVYENALAHEKRVRGDGMDDWKSLESERNDIGDATRGRVSEAADAAAAYRSEKAALEGKAAADRDASNPDAPRPDATPSALETAQGKVSALDAEQALSEIGMSSQTSEQIRSGLIDAHKAIIAQGQADLADSDPSNDSSAYSAISSSASALKSLQDSGVAGGASAAEFMALGTARADMFKAFGSNFQQAGAFGAMHRATKGIGGGGAFGINPGAMGQMPMGGGAGGIVFNQTFQQMPDPHTWSQGVAFELQAAL